MTRPENATARALLAKEWASPLGLELAAGDWRQLVAGGPVPAAILPPSLPSDDVTALWRFQRRPVAWTSQVRRVGDDLRRVLIAAARSFGLAHDVFRLPVLAVTDRPVLVVWERAAEPASVIARMVGAPKVPPPLSEEEAKRKPDQFADE